MPPIVARLDVDVSGPNPSPWTPAARLRSSCTTPGPTRARPPATSISQIWSMWREVSRTMPRPPTAWPARLVPPPRVTTGTPKRAAARIAAATSPAARGGAGGGGDVPGGGGEGDEHRRRRVQARVAGVQVARVVVGADVAAQLA